MNVRDGFERPNRGYREVPATIPCGLRQEGNTYRWCPDWFFCEEGRDLHMAEVHHIGLMIVEAPSSPVGQQRPGNHEDGTTARRGTNTDPKRAASTHELRPTGLLGKMRKVRVRG